MHPSFEDRPGAPDPVIAAVPPAAGDHLAAAWERVLARAWPQPPAVAHLHHLTPIHEAVTRRFPGRADRHPPARDGDPAARAHRPPAGTGRDPRHRPRRDGRRRAVARRPPRTSTRRSAGCCARPAGSSGASATTGPAGCATPRACRAGIVAISPHLRDEARELLDVPPETVESIPNGVDIERFDRQVLDRSERLRRWRHWLVEEPSGLGRVGRRRAPSATARRTCTGSRRAARRPCARAAVRGAVHRGEARPAPAARLRARAREVHDPGAARAVGRLHRESGRASIRTRLPARSARRASSSSGGAVTRSCPRA